jgi:uncharacterized membrane protein YdjX (TVP38/TMEM64 family)
MDRDSPSGDSLGRRFALVRILGLALVLVAVFAVLLLTGSFPTAGEIRDRGDELGALAVVVAVPAFVLLNFAITWAILAGASGLLFGAAVGTPISLVGVVCGALAQMAVARYVAGDHAGRLLPQRARAIEGFLQRRGAVAVMEARIVPALPWGAVNYGAGLTSLRFRDMAIGTAIGGAPKVFAYTALGGSLANIDAIEAKIAIALMVVLAIAGAVLVRRELGGGARPGGLTGAA